jgi:hypothetical protein
MPGGLGDEKKPDDDVNAVVQSVATSIKSGALTSLTQSGGNADPNIFNNSDIKVLAYKTQVVAGTNYFVKVSINNMIFHVRIYQHFSGSTEVTKVVGPKKDNDTLAYFQ